MRACDWCCGEISATVRRDARFCSKRCRQAAHRFERLAVARARAATPLRLAYADPPYPGTAARYYSEHPDYAGEVDHEGLLSQLQEFDGWALSTSAVALPEVLSSCPPGVRVAAWFRGERPTTSYSPLSAWEPVVYLGARRYLSPGSARRVDALVHIARPRLTDPRRIIGAKPATFCAWLFQLLGLSADDELVDLFPGSRGVGLSWETYRAAAEASRDDQGATGLADQVDASLERNTTAR